MRKEDKNILRQAVQSGEGLLSPSIMINSFAQQNRGKVEQLVARGYLEMVPERIHTDRVVNFYRVTEKGLVQFDPWPAKLWFWFRGDVRSVIVSAITAVLVAAVTLLLRLRQ